MLKEISVVLSTTAKQIKQIVGGIVGRLRVLAGSIDRLDRLESGTGEWLFGFNENELENAAHEMTLRTLRTGSDTINYTILKALSADQSVTIPDLVKATSLQRLVLTERLNDLVQVGFATRLIDTGYAQISDAGINYVQLIDGISKLVSQEYLEYTNKELNK